jgi:hypothetical protein
MWVSILEQMVSFLEIVFSYLLIFCIFPPFISFVLFPEILCRMLDLSSRSALCTGMENYFYLWGVGQIGAISKWLPPIWEHCTFVCKIFRCNKVYYCNSITIRLLISCKLSFPTVGLKMSSLPLSSYGVWRIYRTYVQFIVRAVLHTISVILCWGLKVQNKWYDITWCIM